MKKSIMLKAQCNVLLNYFIHINLGGTVVSNIWKWQIDVVSRIEPNSSIDRNQLKCIYYDTIEGIRDFTGEQLKDLFIYGIQNGVEFQFGKAKDLRILNFFLIEKQITNIFEFNILSKLFNVYKEDNKFDVSKKDKIELLLSNFKSNY